MLSPNRPFPDAEQCGVGALLSPNRPFPDAEQCGADIPVCDSRALDLARKENGIDLRTGRPALLEGLDETMADKIRRNTYTGRLTGSPSFAAQLESLLGRVLTPLKRGGKPGKSSESE